MFMAAESCKLGMFREIPCECAVVSERVSLDACATIHAAPWV
jgi:hypothetical protein